MYKNRERNYILILTRLSSIQLRFSDHFDKQHLSSSMLTVITGLLPLAKV